MPTLQRFKVLSSVLILVGVACSASAIASAPCRIRIVDESNGWPVPLVELETTHHVRFVSDNAGVIAFDLPELMNVETWFHVRAHGYSVAKDRFGYAGVRLTPQPGKTMTITVQRQLPGKRLGRLTGHGLFAESQKLGDKLNWKEQGIAGCDSVQNVIHNGQLHWGWGDTSLAKYPLGRFHMTGATTALQPLKTLEPPLGLRFEYVTDAQGQTRDVGKMPGAGPTWLNGYVSLPDKNGIQRLGATYSKIKPPLEEYERGLCIWNEQTQKFDLLKTLWKKSEQSPQPPPSPQGHAVIWRDAAQQDSVLFGDPFPTLKCPATFEAWSSPATWRHLDVQPNVSVKGSLKTIEAHRGAIAWSAFRKKWVTIFTQKGGDSSYLGEIWYAEADSPMGPWRDAIKVVTHDNYTFYNPQLHPGFVSADSSVLLFEATYTATFSAAVVPTPRYNYNQVMYRLDLDEWPWKSASQ